VLDVGCGDGSLLAYLREAKSIVPHGIDVSAVSCEQARRKGIEVTEADVSRDEVLIPKADYIILSEVLEHLPNPEPLLARLRDRFNRRLLIDIPNSGAMNDRLRLLFGRFPKQWVFHPAEHLRFWTIKDFVFLSRQLGYQVDRYYGIYDPYFQLGLQWWRLYPRLFSRYILYVLQ
jgi:methionine biosynthesis protein MetW